jgi:hypothetical protein
VIAATPRLVALVCAFTAVSSLSFWVARRSFSISHGKDALAQGMEWLRHEYRLDGDTFARVIEAHRAYFSECRQRCNELDEVNRHFLSEVQRPVPWNSDLDAVQRLQESICHDCRIAMLEHVHEVASLMPEESGRRFLKDVQSVLQPPPPPVDPAPPRRIPIRPR